MRELNQRQKARLLFSFAVLFLAGIAVAGRLCSEASLVTDFSRKNLAPCFAYPFGTDWLGRDMFLRTLTGLSTSILIGVCAGLVFMGLKKLIHNETISLAVSGFVGSMVNTIGVMGLIYLLFGEQYAAAGGTDPSLLLGVIMGVVGLNGVPEAIIAAVLTAAVSKAVLAVGRQASRA